MSPSFLPQKNEFPNLIVPGWPEPNSGDDLSSYIKRLAADLDPGRPCFVGGASFGRIIALEVARHLNAKACFLIGSIRGPHQLPRRIRAVRSLGFGIGLIPITVLQRSADSSIGSTLATVGSHIAGAMQQFSRSSPAVLRWSARQILRWNEIYDDITVLHIHGELDRVLPIRCVDPDEVVAGGGHIISMTHGHIVNEFLRKQIARIEA